MSATPLEFVVPDASLSPVSGRKISALTPDDTPPNTGTTESVRASKGRAFKTREGLLSPNALVAVTEHEYSVP
ncbi:MAG: hypothetical protein EBR51_12415, partial [Gammaproteobacteria bacterium]|nr:hypothetical protein [Gammaproteobacteria bacterium]